MYLELYTTKSIKQCMDALMERMQEESKVRLPMDGWVEKGGAFLLACTSKVFFINRRTKLNGTLERENGLTVIRGYVNDGVPPRQIGIVVGAILLVAATMLLNGQAPLALVVALVGLAVYVPLVGDYNNSNSLVKEIKRLLAAKDKPPVANASAQTASAKAAPKGTPKKPMTATPTRTGTKPAPKPTANTPKKPTSTNKAVASSAKKTPVR